MAAAATEHNTIFRGKREFRSITTYNEAGCYGQIGYEGSPIEQDWRTIEHSLRGPWSKVWIYNDSSDFGEASHGELWLCLLKIPNRWKRIEISASAPYRPARLHRQV